MLKWGLFRSYHIPAKCFILATAEKTEEGIVSEFFSIVAERNGDYITDYRKTIRPNEILRLEVGVNEEEQLEYCFTEAIEFGKCSITLALIEKYCLDSDAQPTGNRRYEFVHNMTFAKDGLYPLAKFVKDHQYFDWIVEKNPSLQMHMHVVKQMSSLVKD